MKNALMFIAKWSSEIGNFQVYENTKKSGIWIVTSMYTISPAMLKAYVGNSKSGEIAATSENEGLNLFFEY